MDTNQKQTKGALNKAQMIQRISHIMDLFRSGFILSEIRNDGTAVFYDSVSKHFFILKNGSDPVPSTIYPQEKGGENA